MTFSFNITSIVYSIPIYNLDILNFNFGVGQVNLLRLVSIFKVAQVVLDNKVHSDSRENHKHECPAINDIPGKRRSENPVREFEDIRQLNEENQMSKPDIESKSFTIRVSYVLIVFSS